MSNVKLQQNENILLSIKPNPKLYAWHKICNPIAVNYTTAFFQMVFLAFAFLMLSLFIYRIFPGGTFNTQSFYKNDGPGLTFFFVFIFIGLPLLGAYRFYHEAIGLTYYLTNQRALIFSGDKLLYSFKYDEIRKYKIKRNAQDQGYIIFGNVAKQYPNDEGGYFILREKEGFWGISRISNIDNIIKNSI